MSPYIRNNRAIIRVFGSDAQKLLNDVLSVEFTIGENKAKWWALLSPQGKIQVEGLGFWFENAFWLEMYKDIVDSFLKKMRLYKMRAKVELEDLSQSHIVGWSINRPSEGSFFIDPRDRNLGFHIFAPKENIGDWQSDENKYLLKRIELGIAELGEDFEPDVLFAHDIGMDLLQGVDFSKGCYIGQEIVSRMQHKGEIKRRVLIANNVEANAGSKLTIDGKKIGFLGKLISKKSLAFVRLDRINNKNHVLANDKPIQLSIPKWADYQF